ncbi:MAG: XdhC family protein [Actinomycetota bacterium]
MIDHSLDGWAVVEKAVELARRGEDFVLATVVWRQGPSSGKHGSRAIVTASGELHGWIGGACAEPVLIREATRALADRQPRLLLLGTTDELSQVPEGMTHIAISCQSDGAMQIYIEPVQGAPHLVVVGHSPMAQTLCQLATDLNWRAEVIDGPEFTTANIDTHALVVVATQGHGDEEVMEQAIAGGPAYLGVVASRRRGEAILGYLADRGVPQSVLDRVHVPAGLDLGHTSHREVAVAVLAELVQLRAAGAFISDQVAEMATQSLTTDSSKAIDPVCGMTVSADRTSRPFEYNGATYFFCCPGCHDAFAKNPAAHLPQEATC